MALGNLFLGNTKAPPLIDAMNTGIGAVLRP